MGRRAIPMAALGKLCAVCRDGPDFESGLRVALRLGRCSLNLIPIITAKFQTETLPGGELNYSRSLEFDGRPMAGTWSSASMTLLPDLKNQPSDPRSAIHLVDLLGSSRRTHQKQRAGKQHQALHAAPYPKPIDPVPYLDGRSILDDAPYRSGPSKTWLKWKNPTCEAVRREREEDWN